MEPDGRFSGLPGPEHRRCPGQPYLLTKITMDTTTNTPPLACTLTDAELARRKAGLQQEVFSRAYEIAEAEDGYVFYFADEDALLSRLIEYMLAEKACCPFFRFDLSIRPYREGIVWKLSGVPEVKAMLRAWVADVDR